MPILFMAAFTLQAGIEWVQQRPRDLQSLKYLTFGHFREKFANPMSRACFGSLEWDASEAGFSGDSVGASIWGLALWFELPHS